MKKKWWAVEVDPGGVFTQLHEAETKEEAEQEAISSAAEQYRDLGEEAFSAEAKPATEEQLKEEGVEGAQSEKDTTTGLLWWFGGKW